MTGNQTPPATHIEPMLRSERGRSLGWSWQLREVWMVEKVRTDWIEETEVSATRILSYMHSILVDAEIDDEGYIFLKDGLEHPAWIFVDAPRTLVHLIAQVPLRPDAGLHAIAVNELNKDYVGVQFHTLYGALWGNAWLSYKTGMCLRHLAHIVPLFASAVLHAIHEPCVRHLVLRDLRTSH